MLEVLEFAVVEGVEGAGAGKFPSGILSVWARSRKEMGEGWIESDGLTSYSTAHR